MSEEHLRVGSLGGVVSRWALNGSGEPHLRPGSFRLCLALSGPLPVLLAGIGSSQRPAAAGTITAPFAEMRKVKLTAVEWFYQSRQLVEAQV